MKRIRIRDYLIHGIVLLLTAIWFVKDFGKASNFLMEKGIAYSIIVIVTVILVHGIKLCRLYLALFGTNIGFRRHAIVYCRVIPTGIVFPYKLGELYRIYGYGTALNDMMRGTLIVLLDRFTDTLALMTMIFLFWMIHGGQITPLIFILIIFFSFALLLFYVLPGLIRFWKHLLIGSHATKRKLTMLRSLDSLNRVYGEVKNISKGRGVIMYFSSLLAWSIEIGSIYLRAILFSGTSQENMISRYLMSAMGGAESIEMCEFVFVSVILLTLIYAGLKAREICFSRKGKPKNDATCYL